MEFGALETNFENRLPFKFSWNNYYSHEMKLLEQKKKIREKTISLFPCPRRQPLLPVLMYISSKSHYFIYYNMTF